MKMTDQTEQTFTAFIKDKFGIHLQAYQQLYLHDAIISACKKFNYSSAIEYLNALSHFKQDAPQLIHLIDAITVDESYFFRDAEQNQLLENELFPRIIHQHRKCQQLTLRIWSAGCARGQEIYTVAIILYQLLPDIKKWNIHLLATDINCNTLSEAIKGQYSNWSMRATPDLIRNQYFHVDSAAIDPCYHINEHLKKMVKFSYLNLSQDTFPSIWNETNNLDLILCRNVFIYLSQPEKPKIIDKFSHCLNTNGLLIFSASDLINYDCPYLKKHLYQNRDYFSKASEQPFEANKIDIAPINSIVNEPHANSIQSVSQSNTQSLATSYNHDNVAPLKTIQAMMTNGQWYEAVKVCDQLLEASSTPPFPLTIQYKAKSLANIGKLEEAANLCLTYLNTNPLDKHIYLIYSLVLVEQGEYEQACAYLKKSIFIDSHFLEAYYHYGMLQIRQGMLPAGLAKLEFVVNQVNDQNAHYIVHNTANETYEHFANTIRQEILMFKTLLKDVS